MRSGSGARVAKFIVLVQDRGPVRADWVDRPAPDPAVFGAPSEDDGSRKNLLGQNMTSNTDYEPDFDALTNRGAYAVPSGWERRRCFPSRHGEDGLAIRKDLQKRRLMAYQRPDLLRMPFHERQRIHRSIAAGEQSTGPALCAG
jgi:hypothetical protein